MSQTSRICWNNTKVYKRGSADCVMLHSTEIVCVDWPRVKLDTGGWKTATTRTRMNQVANERRLGFGVFQKKGEWFVKTPHTDWHNALPFTGDSIEFSLAV